MSDREAQSQVRTQPIEWNIVSQGAHTQVARKQPA